MGGCCSSTASPPTPKSHPPPKTDESGGVTVSLALFEQLRREHTPRGVLSYSSARSFIYGVLDNRGGSVHCVYSDRAEPVENQAENFQIVDAGTARVRLVAVEDVLQLRAVRKDLYDKGAGMNLEHIFPQSFLKKGGCTEGVSDMHHMAPADVKINGTRSNHRCALAWSVLSCCPGVRPGPDVYVYNRFGEVDEGDMPGHVTLLGKKYLQDSGVAGSDDGPADPHLSEFDAAEGKFEPCERSEGNVARAMLYVALIYGERMLGLGLEGAADEQQRQRAAWLAPQLGDLKAWSAKDPVDAEERRRNVEIAKVQGNTNPFVDDPTLVDRVFL